MYDANDKDLRNNDITTNIIVVVQPNGDMTKLFRPVINGTWTNLSGDDGLTIYQMAYTLLLQP